MERLVTFTKIYCSAISHQSALCPTLPFAPPFFCRKLAPLCLEGQAFDRRGQKIEVFNNSPLCNNFNEGSAPFLKPSSSMYVAITSRHTPSSPVPTGYLPAEDATDPRSDLLSPFHAHSHPQIGPSSSVPPQSYLCGLSLLMPPNGICWELSRSICVILFIFRPSLFNNLSKALCWILFYVFILQWRHPLSQFASVFHGCSSFLRFWDFFKASGLPKSGSLLSHRLSLQLFSKSSSSPTTGKESASLPFVKLLPWSKPSTKAALPQNRTYLLSTASHGIPWPIISSVQTDMFSAVLTALATLCPSLNFRFLPVVFCCQCSNCCSFSVWVSQDWICYVIKIQHIFLNKRWGKSMCLVCMHREIEPPCIHCIKIRNSYFEGFDTTCLNSCFKPNNWPKTTIYNCVIVSWMV